MLFLVVHTMVALSLKKHIRPVTPTTESCHSPNAKEARLFERTRSPTSSGEDEGFESESNLSRPGSDLSSDGDDASGGSSDVGFRSGTGDIHSGSRGGVPGAVALFSAADAPLSHLLTCTEMRRSAWEEVMAVLSLYIRGKYAASVADRMILMIEPKLACKIDMLSYEQVAMLRERAREKQQDSELSGIDEMFQRMAGIS